MKDKIVGIHVGNPEHQMLFIGVADYEENMTDEEIIEIAKSKLVFQVRELPQTRLMSFKDTWSQDGL